MLHRISVYEHVTNCTDVNKGNVFLMLFVFLEENMFGYSDILKAVSRIPILMAPSFCQRKLVASIVDLLNEIAILKISEAPWKTLWC